MQFQENSASKISNSSQPLIEKKKLNCHQVISKQANTQAELGKLEVRIANSV